MSKIVLSLIALVAMIGIVFGVAPMQLSGEVGKNISVNLTDDVSFQVGNDTFHSSSNVIYFSNLEAHNANTAKIQWDGERIHC